MSDREEAIKGLEQFKSDLKPFCGSHADWERFDAGLAILKEQGANENKYEYKYDHTDCIWYHDGRGRCPVTCSQYRDGWNDAMNYIFKNGPGYRPYKRSVR